LSEKLIFNIILSFNFADFKIRLFRYFFTIDVSMLFIGF